jgi:fructose-specific phosphotransferase system IIC component
MFYNSDMNIFSDSGMPTASKTIQFSHPSQVLIPIKVTVDVSLTGAIYITNGALPLGNANSQVLIPFKMTGQVSLTGTIYITDGALPLGNANIQVLIPFKMTGHVSLTGATYIADCTTPLGISYLNK